ncbi:MAG: MATE family efflux transporter [Clostridia bacterium]|nr:MATE family efflux transporter [Clostridia bacterium]
MEKTKNFTEGRILAPLIGFALPVLLALFLQSMYGAVDLLIVGQYAQTTDVSAVATGSQVMHSVTTVLVGMAMGITVLLGQKIGEGSAKQAGRVIGTGVSLFTALALVLTAVLVGLAEPLSKLMQAPADALAATTDYVRICSAGTVFIIAFNVLGSVFRGIGDSKMPLITVAIACVVNILGDLLLVAGLHMGAAGAALATIGAQAVSVALSLLIISRKKLPFEFTRTDLRLNRPIAANILKIGTPMALQDLLVSISFLVVLAIVNSLGLIQSAGVGVAEKLCGFIMLIPSAYMQSMSAFVAQNIGAGKPQRARRALLCGISTSLLVSVFISYFSFFHGDVLAGIFAKDAEVIAAAADYLRAYAVDCLLTSFLFCFIGYFSGMGRTVFVMSQGLVGAFLVRIPVSFAMSRIAGVSLFAIGLATPASTIVQIALCAWYMARCLKQERMIRA